MAPEQLAQLVVYIKDDCHLCDNLLSELRRSLEQRSPEQRPRVVIRDIEERDDWFREYREYVPVIVLGQEEICHYFFDEIALDEALAGNAI